MTAVTGAVPAAPFAPGALRRTAKGGGGTTETTEEIRSTMVGEAVLRGVRKGFETMWILGKTLVPAYVVVHLLAKTPLLDWLSDLTGPWLHWIGLPGEAAVPLMLGLLLNLYAAVGAMASLELTVKEATIIAIFLSMAHALIVETAVTSRIGVPARFALSVRLSLAVVLAFAVHLVWRS